MTRADLLENSIHLSNFSITLENRNFMTLERWNDERLDRLALSVEHLSTDIRDGFTRIQDGFSEIRSNIAALTRLAQLQQDNVEAMQRSMTQQQERFDAAITRMDQAILELRAGQQRQDAILDYLIGDGQRG
jgi:methyl-accepting chemotaxis protein